MRAFSSVCGGLPSPAALAPDNPLQYGFSWSPAGVLSAAMTPCRYKRSGAVVEEDGAEKLLRAAPFLGFPSLNLEQYANRDSLAFGELYGIEQEAHTIFRGTLRFRGWCELMHDLSLLGLVDGKTSAGLVGAGGGGAAAAATTTVTTWGDVLGGLGEVEARLRSAGACDGRVASTLRALSWLGASPDSPLPHNKQPWESSAAAFCQLLTEKLSLRPGEADLVVMQHDFDFEFDDRREAHVSGLLAFGDDKGTAMAKTVGFTAAIAADLVLEGRLDDHPGVATPMLKEVYQPGLERLKAEGITFNERHQVFTK